MHISIARTRSLNVLLLFFNIFCVFCLYGIREKSLCTLSTISSLSEAQKEFDTATDRTLFVFDLDETLITSNDPTFQLERLLFDTFNFLTNFAKSSDESTKKIVNRFPEHEALTELATLLPNNKRIATLLRLYPDEQSGKEFEKIFALYLTFLTTQKPLHNYVHFLQKHDIIETVSPSMIRALKEKNVSIVALSAFHSQQSDQTKENTPPTTQEVRYAELEKLGITFSTKKELHVEPISFFNLGNHPNHKPDYTPRQDILFYKGIISTAAEKKGEVLSYFIRCMHKKPRKVIFFDNVFDNLVSVAEKLNNLGLPVHCYFYTAEQELPKTKIDFPILQTQYKYIENNRVYFTYNKIRALTHMLQQKDLSNQTPPLLPGAVETEE